MKLQIAIDGKTYELEVEVVEEDPPSRPRAHLLPYSTPPTIMLQSLPPPAAPSQTAAPAEGQVDEARVCRSPVAGVVIRINVQRGQLLQPNDLIMVLEAMKMETHVTAPAVGRVKATKVSPGEGVQVNQVLVEFE